jgi:hypothetical protein
MLTFSRKYEINLWWLNEASVPNTSELHKVEEFALQTKGNEETFKMKSAPVARLCQI